LNSAAPRILSLWLVGLLSLAPTVFAEAGEEPILDFLFFIERVQPVLLEDSSERASCISCHLREEPRLEPSSSGSSEQSRRNFDRWKAAVVAGKPLESPALLAPLAASGGGLASHAGAKPWASTADPAWQTLAGWVRGRRLGALAIPPDTGPEYVFQTSAADQGVHVLAPGRQEAIGLVEGSDAPAGVAASPDGRRIYLSNPGHQTLDIADFKTLQVFKRIPLSGRPAAVVSGRSGSKVYVAVASGSVDVIDAEALVRVNTIALGGPVEGIFSTPDGTHLAASSPESPRLVVVDLVREAVSWHLKLEAGAGAVAFVPNGDGSTRDILVQLAGLRGFAVVDFATRTQISRIQMPARADLAPKDQQTLSVGGLAVTSNLEFSNEWVLWSVDKVHGSVVAFGVPERCYPRRSLRPGERCDWEVLGTVEVGPRPESLVSMPDSKSLYVVLAGADQTAVIDVASMAVVRRVPVGAGPGRSAAATMRAR